MTQPRPGQTTPALPTTGSGVKPADAYRQLQQEARELEGKYGRGFLEKSLHGSGIRYRQITAPNARGYAEQLLADKPR